jgi:hypothetical protein
MAALLARFLKPGSHDRAWLERLVRPSLRNWNGIEVGEIRPAAELTAGTPTA